MNPTATATATPTIAQWLATLPSVGYGCWLPLRVQRAAGRPATPHRIAWATWEIAHGSYPGACIIRAATANQPARRQK